MRSHHREPSLLVSPCTTFSRDAALQELYDRHITSLESEVGVLTSCLLVKASATLPRVVLAREFIFVFCGHRKLRLWQGVGAGIVGDGRQASILEYLVHFVVTVNTQPRANRAVSLAGRGRRAHMDNAATIANACLLATVNT